MDPRKSATVLVVDDDPSTCRALRMALEGDRFDVLTCGSAEDAVDMLAANEVHLLITDVVMKGMSGLRLLEHAQQKYSDLPVVVCSGFASVESAVEALRHGATDYFTKPINLDELTATIERALRTSALQQENLTLRDQLFKRHSFHGILARSPAMVSIFDRLETIVPTDVTVLLRGESGTGKEVIARHIHRESQRADQPMMTVDCAALSESLVESELFGHEKGAFTGADRMKMGKIETADGGTLFLDEVGDLPPASQTKLLRILQEQTLVRVGGTHEIVVDLRVIAATNRNLERMIRDGTFREDLYYRLNVVSVVLPPLRDRAEDIELLMRRFLSEFAQQHGRPSPYLHRTTREVLSSYCWPGNVRELRNLCESLVVTSRSDMIKPSDLPQHIVEGSDDPKESARSSLLDGTHTLAEIERQAIFQTLARAYGNKTLAAQTLGIGLKTLYRRLAEYAPDDPAEE